MAARIVWVFAILQCLGYVKPWICGDEAQCNCFWNGIVRCNDLEATPVFPMAVRRDRELYLIVTEAFDMDSLKETLGFNYVEISGLNTDQCAVIWNDYPWIQCLVNRQSTTPRSKDIGLRSEINDLTAITTSTVKKSSRFTERITAESVTRDADFITTVAPTSDEQKEGKAIPPAAYATPAWIIVVAVTAVTSLIVLSFCILVSLVNLHERINLRTRSDDAPICAIYCCKVIMACCLLPLHLCARLCRCNWRRLSTLDYSSESLYMSSSV